MADFNFGNGSGLFDAPASSGLSGANLSSGFAKIPQDKPATYATAVTSITSNIDKKLSLPGKGTTGTPPTTTNNGAIDVRAKIKVKPSQLSALTPPQRQDKGANTADPQQSVLGPRDDKTNILLPLYETSGMMFPYTPVVTVANEVAYQQLAFTHSIYDQQSYARTNIANIQIQSTFSAQTEDEARYLIASIHFLRTVTKMYFGNSGGKTGSPPPVLLFDYLGGMFNNVPVVVSDFSYTFPKDVDLVNILYADGIISVPVLMDISVTLKTQYNPYKLKNEFNLDNFRTGKMLKKGYI